MEQKKTFKRVLASSLAVLLVGAGAGITAKMIKDSRQINPDIKIELPDAGGAVIDTEIGNSPSMRLTATRLMSSEYEANGVSAQAESAYTLTATITPADAANKKLNWTVTFKNASSTWATGKTVTDYVTVTPSSDGALTAVVENKAAFGEQILVKATSRDNANATASCTVDYNQKVTGYAFTLDGKTFNTTGTKTYAYQPDFSKSKSPSTAITVNKSTVYTLSCSPVVEYFTIKPTAVFKTAITNVGLDATKLKEYSYAGATGGINNFLDTEWGKALYGMSGTNKNKLINAVKNFSGNAYEIKIYNTNGGTELAAFNITLDSSVIVGQKGVESIRLDETQIVF